MTSTSRILPAILGFAFVAVAFAENLGVAILCLVGAAVFQLVAALYRGDVSLEDLQDRAEAARSGFNGPERTSVR
jgi:hypothetical protein